MDGIERPQNADGRFQHGSPSGDGRDVDGLAHASDPASGKGCHRETEGEGLQHQPGLLGIEATLGVVEPGHQLPQLLQLGEGQPGQRLLNELLAALPDAQAEKCSTSG